MKFRLLIRSILFLAPALPIAAVMGWLPPGLFGGLHGGGDLRLAAARTERLLAFLAACAAIGFGLYLYVLHLRKRRNRVGHPIPFEFSDEVIPSGAVRRTTIRDVLTASLPGLPLIVYTLLFTLRAHDALFMVDLDFTGISSAMNNTAKGHGLLTTPYFHTGTGGGYLGHHFSPTLLSFVPLYFMANLWSLMVPGVERMTHLIYGLVLWGWLVVGVLAWGRLLAERLGNPLLAGGLMAILMTAYPLHRLVLSFHYELPAFACSALVFIALRENRPLLLWAALLGWVGVKEDAALYVLLFSLALFTVRVHRRVALRISIFALVYFVLANLMLRPYFAGGQGPVWNYWQGGPLEGVMNLVASPRAWQAPLVLFTGVLKEVPGVLGRLPYSSLFDLLFAFAFLPLLSKRLSLFTLPLIFAVHLVSGHRWHATFYGHYSYSVLPFLMLGTVHGFSILAGLLCRVRNGAFKGGVPALLLFAAAVAAYSAAGDKETPLPPPGQDVRTKTIAPLLNALPRGSCLRTQTFFTAHAPLDVYTFPLEIPRGNPMRNQVPPHAYHRGPGFPPCERFYVLLDVERFAPYYSKAYMARFRALMEEGINRGLLERKSISKDKRLRLYRVVQTKTMSTRPR